MERIAKQVLNVKGRKGCAAALSREYQRNWSDRAWQVAIAKGNYDLGRQHLNFQISKGGKIAPIDKSKSIPQMMAENLAARGIKDKNEGLTEPRFMTVADFIFSGSQWKMRELAFGDQEVVFKPGDNKENYAVKRMPEIEQWATDIYNFVAGKYGEENIVAFYVHLDETSPHIHCVLLPIKDGKFAFEKSSQVPTIGNIVNVHRNFMTSWRWSMSLGDWCVERAKRRLGNDTDLRRNTASTCPRNVLQRKRNWTTLTRL